MGTVATAAEGVRPVLVDDATKTSAAVVVDGSRHLVYTAQLLPLDEQARDIAVDDPVRQSQAVLDNLEHALKPTGSGLDQLIRLNVYLAKPEIQNDFQAVLARRMAAVGARPAVTYVVTGLTRPRVLVGVDAVAATSLEPRKSVAVQKFNLPDLTVQRLGNHAAILPSGARMFVSGQAEPGDSVAEATRKTLAGLEATLKHFGLVKQQIVQAKAFIQPMDSVGDAESEYIDFFGPAAIPPLAFVEWKSSAKQPIEIELVVAAGQGTDAELIEYLAPPQLKHTPVYSRFVRVNRGDLIYTSGLEGTAKASGAEQARSIFDFLSKVLDESGSDLRHMAKATYYVSDDEASAALNDIRPKLYDPARPPAASKAMVVGVPPAGHSLALDMIAVPKHSADRQ
jgi:enamine deaminase RidA (YjgF/YER057c/UK114 family)